MQLKDVNTNQCLYDTFSNKKGITNLNKRKGIEVRR